eukprot:803652-Pelagomonas_calceolata.AAC.2
MVKKHVNRLHPITGMRTQADRLHASAHLQCAFNWCICLDIHTQYACVYNPTSIQACVVERSGAESIPRMKRANRLSSRA